MILSAYFAEAGTPKIGLNPTINIYNLDTSALVVAAAAMVGVGDGFYTYTFAAHNPEIHYSFICDAGVALTGAQRYSIGSIDPDPMFTSNVEGSITVQEALAVLLAYTLNKRTGGGTKTLKYRNALDTVNRITQTVNSKGEVTAVTLDTSDL
jgi:hypothetical protein